MKALVLLAPLPLALLLGSALLPTHAVQVVNRTGSDLGQLQVCFEDGPCQQRPSLAAGQQWTLVAPTRAEDVRLKLAKKTIRAPLRGSDTPVELQFVVGHDSQVTVRTQ